MQNHASKSPQKYVKVTKFHRKPYKNQSEFHNLNRNELKKRGFLHEEIETRIKCVFAKHRIQKPILFRTDLSQKTNNQIPEN